MPVIAWVVSVVVLLVAIYYYNLEDMPSEIRKWTFRMGEEAEENRKQFREMNKSAFILGYTGESGKALLREVLQSKVFSRVVLIGRREVQYEDELYKEVEQKVIDFEKVDDYAEAFRDIDVGFCCLGTTRGKSGKDGFYKVDHDYILNTARVAKASGCKHLHLVSSQGANKNSFFLYTKTKGEVEAELGDLGFDRLSIYRPAVLMCDREESRPAEAVTRALLKPLAKAFPTAITTPVTTLATAMVNAAVSSPSNQSVELFDNKAIFALAGQIKSESKKTKAEN